MLILRAALAEAALQRMADNERELAIDYTEPYCDDCGGTDPECPLKLTEEFVCSTGLCRYRKPLTDAEIDAITVQQWGRDFMVPAAGRAWARAIEAAHGIKQEEA